MRNFFTPLLLWTADMVTTGFALRMAEEVPTKRKLVVNSHVAYGKVFDGFMMSLKTVNFTDWGDVIVVQGGSTMDKDPYVGQNGMTFVQTTMNNFDLHGFAMLFRHRHHPLLQADVYFYTHDSVMVGPCFPQVFKEVTVAPAEVTTAGKVAFSNICVFGHEVVDRYGTNFETILTKEEGVWLEARGKTIKNVHPIGTFGAPWTQLPKRKYLQDLDLYATGHPRKVFWYREWDLYKAILHGAQGDITGNYGPIRTKTSELDKEVRAPRGETWAKACARTQSTSLFLANSSAVPST